MMKKLCLFLLFCAAVCQLHSRELQIIATCDMHGNLSGFARLLPVIQQYPDAVKLDLGDLFQGEVLPDLLKGEPMMSALNLAKYDFFIPGNHEFELPLPQLSGFLNSFNGQVLGQFRIPGVKILPWQLVKRNGFTLAVIGMTDNGIYRDRKLYPGLKIAPEFAAVEKAMQDIRKHKVDAVILARHGGNYLSGMTLGRFLRKYPEIRLVICGHSHQEIPGQRSGRTMIVQPGAHCTSAVLVTLRKIAGKELLLTGSLLRPGKLPAPEIVSLQEDLQKKYGSVLQQTRLDFTSFEAQVDLWLKEFCTVSGADCAVIDLSPIPPGNYTLEQLLKLFAYRNQLLKLTVTASEYASLLREKVPSKRKRFAAAAPAGRKEFTIVLDTFQFSRSKTLNRRNDFQLLPVISRDIILKGFDDEKTLHDR